MLPGEVTAVLAGFPEPLVVIEPGGMLVFLNDAAGRLLEVSGDVAGTALSDFLPERERTRLDPLAWLQRWAERPDAPEMDYVHLNCRTASGRELPVRVRVGRFQQADSTYYLVMLQDISREQLRQQQSRRAHRLAARVLAISADAIVTVSPDLTISYANPSAERLFGYGSGALLGRPLGDLLPSRFRADHPDQIARFAGEPRPARLMGERAEIVGLTSAGEEVPLEASITKVTLDRDVYFSAHLRDLRPRRLAEQELARTRASLQTIFDHAIQAMALIDTAGRVLEMNAAARQLLPGGVDPVGRDFASLPFFSADPTNTASGLKTALDRCLAGEPYRITTRVSRPDGQQQTLDFSLTPVRDAGRTFAVVAEARALLGAGDH